MNSERDGLARSLQTRLARHAKEIGVEPNLPLTRHAIERSCMAFSSSTTFERTGPSSALLLDPRFARYLTLRTSRAATRNC